MFSNPSRVRVQLDCGDVNMTKQSHKAECDINNILKQYQKTGIIEHVNQSTASYLDLPSTMDYQQSLAIIEEASDAFSQLPSVVRDRYRNDPMVFLGALSDPSQTEFLTECGILKPPAPTELPASQGEAKPPAGGGA